MMMFTRQDRASGLKPWLPMGSLIDDFHIMEAERMVHVLNAPSPAATASLIIGRHIADVARRDFDLAA